MGEKKPCHTCGGTRGVEVRDCRTITVRIALDAGVEMLVHVYSPSPETMSSLLFWTLRAENARPQARLAAVACTPLFGLGEEGFLGSGLVLGLPVSYSILRRKEAPLTGNPLQRIHPALNKT